MLARKFFIILILASTLFAWTGSKIWAAFSSEECKKCCPANRQCSKPLEKSCEKNPQVKKSSCDPLYKPSEKGQATLPGGAKSEYKGYRENPTPRFAIIFPNLKLNFASFSHYINYMPDTQSPLICSESIQFRAPPTYIHS